MQQIKQLARYSEDKAVQKTENIDGYKFYLSDNEWVMIRPSGTEPVLRVYAHAADYDAVRKILNDTHKTLQEGLS